MNMKTISTIVGCILLAFALLLASLSYIKQDRIIANSNNIIENYLHKSSQSLNKGNHKDAIKYAKLAIKINSNNPKAFKAYENAIKKKYGSKLNHTNTPLIKNNSKHINDDEEEEEEGLGC